MIEQRLFETVQRWIDQDPDAQTKQELSQLCDDAGKTDESATKLHHLFSNSLKFGTAGLRGQLGLGPNRMNRVTVIRASAGLGQYLSANGFAGKRIVIGFDARHKSSQFAQDAAEIFAGLGFETMIFGDVVPTPVLAFAVLQQQACAGVMVTASHNPASDNGYKVYLGDGRQIVSPTDLEILQCIDNIDDIRTFKHSNDVIVLGQDVVTQYVEATAEIVRSGPVPRDAIEAVRYVYTAMHGVGYRTFSSVMQHAGFSKPDSVAQQQNPNPDFPTVAYPNPEEAGALDLAVQQATTQQANIIIAHDPDADRLAVAIPDAQGVWTQLRGDEVGTLLGWWMIERSHRMSQSLSGSFANSIVSSTLLGKLAEREGLKFEQTLTGFKWVSRVPDLVYGYEEALGYCIDPEHVRDKDGISAALLILEMYAALHADEKTLWDVLDELNDTFGFHVTDQLTIRIDDVAQVKDLINKLIVHTPKQIGNFELLNVTDLSLGSHLPPTDGVLLTWADQESNLSLRIIVRPSGTEPKLKCYLELIADAKVHGSKDELSQTLLAVKESLKPIVTVSAK